MKFSVVTAVLALGSFAAAAPTVDVEERGLIVARDATTTLLGDIATISSRLATLNNDVNSFTGGSAQVFQALAIYNDANSVQSALNQANTDAINSPNLNDTGSAAVATAVTGLQPNIYNILNQLVAKKAGFRTVVFGSSAVGLVNNTITSLQQSTKNFGGNLTAKFSGSISTLAPLVTGDINFHFTRASQAYYSP